MNTVGPDGRTQYYRLAPAEAIQSLGSHKMGLTNAEAARRHSDEGANTLPSITGQSVFLRLAGGVTHPLMLGMLFCMLLAILLDQSGLAIGLLAVAAVRLAIRLFLSTPPLARTQLPALPDHAVVIRNGQNVRIETAKLVIGDLVQIKAGDIVPADIRLLTVDGLVIDETALFGTNAAVKKSTRSIGRETVLRERSNLAWMGTRVVRGTAAAIVTGISAQTELGRIILLTNTVAMNKKAATGWSRSWLVTGILVALAAAMGLSANIDSRAYLVGLLGLSLACLPLGLDLAVLVGLWWSRPRAGINLATLEHLGNIDTLLTREQSVAKFKAFGLRVLHVGYGDSSLRLGELSDGELLVSLESGSAVFGELTSEETLRLVRGAQLSGHRVAVLSQGLNDLPARAQADASLTLRSDLVNILTSAHSATSIVRQTRLLLFEATAALAGVAALGLIGFWWWHLPMAVSPALVIAFGVICLPTLGLSFSVNKSTVPQTELLVRAAALAITVFGVFLLFFIIHAIDPTFIDPANYLVLQAITTSFSALVASLAIERFLDTGKTFAAHQRIAVVACGLLLILLNVSYNPWLQGLLGTHGLDVVGCLIVVAAATLYGLFVVFLRHTRRHSRHTILQLHRDAFGVNTKLTL